VSSSTVHIRSLALSLSRSHIQQQHQADYFIAIIKTIAAQPTANDYNDTLEYDDNCEMTWMAVLYTSTHVREYKPIFKPTTTTTIIVITTAAYQLPSSCEFLQSWLRTYHVPTSCA
jgi:hypothetical protein